MQGCRSFTALRIQLPELVATFRIEAKGLRLDGRADLPAAWKWSCVPK